MRIHSCEVDHDDLLAFLQRRLPQLAQLHVTRLTNFDFDLETLCTGTFPLKSLSLTPRGYNVQYYMGDSEFETILQAFPGLTELILWDTADLIVSRLIYPALKKIAAMIIQCKKLTAFEMILYSPDKTDSFTLESQSLKRAILTNLPVRRFVLGSCPGLKHLFMEIDEEHEFEIEIGKPCTKLENFEIYGSISNSQDHIVQFFHQLTQHAPMCLVSLDFSSILMSCILENAFPFPCLLVGPNFDLEDSDMKNLHGLITLWCYHPKDSQQSLASQPQPTIDVFSFDPYWTPNYIPKIWTITNTGDFFRYYLKEKKQRGQCGQLDSPPMLIVLHSIIEEASQTILNFSSLAEIKGSPLETYLE